VDPPDLFELVRPDMADVRLAVHGSAAGVPSVASGHT
jgi:hypothetical protein